MIEVTERALERIDRADQAGVGSFEFVRSNADGIQIRAERGHHGRVQPVSPALRAMKGLIGRRVESGVAYPDVRLQADGGFPQTGQALGIEVVIVCPISNSLILIIARPGLPPRPFPSRFGRSAFFVGPGRPGNRRAHGNAARLLGGVMRLGASHLLRRQKTDRLPACRTPYRRFRGYIGWEAGCGCAVARRGRGRTRRRRLLA